MSRRLPGWGDIRLVAEHRHLSTRLDTAEADVHEQCGIVGRSIVELARLEVTVGRLAERALAGDDLADVGEGVG